MQRDAGRSHRDDGGQQPWVESVHEPANGIRVARQLGDERSVGERRELGGRKVHDGGEDSLLELYLYHPGAGEGEPLEAGRQDGAECQQRGEDGERSNRRQAAHERVDEAPHREWDDDADDGHPGQ